MENVSTQWPRINKGDIVDVVAPSGKITPADIRNIDIYLKSIGFIPRIPEDILGEHLFSANTDEKRFLHLKNALEAEDSTLLWCVRGGHGVTKIMPDLIKLSQPKKQKLLVGFSDITSLHLWLNQAWHWPSCHGPMARLAASSKIDSQDLEALYHLWFKGLRGYALHGLQALNPTAEKIELIEGITIGTCLSLLETSIGTPWELNAEGKIIVIEDINEYPYRIDRMLVHLANAGLLDKSRAIIFGDFGEKPNEEKELLWVLDDFIHHYLPKTRDIMLPAFRLGGLGHGDRNQPLPLGIHTTLKRDTTTTWMLSFDSNT